MRSAKQAADWAEARESYFLVDYCMRAVLDAFDLLPIAGFPNATTGWTSTQHKYTDRTPPRGAPVYFPNYGAGKSGHVAISLGGGLVRSTGIGVSDYFTATISQVAARCGNAYAGWAGDFAGRLIDFATTAGSGGTDDDMPLNDDDKDWIRLAVQQEIDRSKDWTREMTRQELTPVVKAIAAANDLDPDELADELAPLLLPSLIAALSKDTLNAIKALDTQSDKYQAELKAILSKGLTGTLTLAPAK